MKNINIKEKEYPNLLKEIPDPPDKIFYKGTPPLPDELMISIVGTRKAGPEGKALAKEIANDLSEAGITIVSGMALGVDGAAHRGALENDGKTVAVLAHGLDTIYPKEHGRLSKEIIEKGGSLISQYSPNTTPAKHRFLERNRIVSGLSIATVIVEAPSRSGTLSTAKHALEQNRDIFVIPGFAKDKNYKGSHKLLREGARLATNAKEILNDLNLVKNSEQPKINFKTS